ncbi:MAG: type VI secretion system tip protein VgrG, partial [Pseudomonadales bacterium]|nr:type VI secretion system tip protein VgrG [Pseudomonadales bacterium]
MSYFSDLDQKRFSFESLGNSLNKDSFAVINFQGFEALSKTYQFDVLLVSNKKDIDIDDVIQNPAVFKIHRGDQDDVLFNGILQDFEQLHEFNNHVYYRAKLVPKLWWLNLTTHNQVFLKQSVTDLVQLALEDADLETQDFEFSSLINNYEQNAYVCQYSESHFQFVSRWLEREGIYYHFEQKDDGEVIVFDDDCSTHEKLKISGDLIYQPATGLESSHLAETIYSLTCRQKQLPKEVILKDYDYENPSLDVSGLAVVAPKGRGVSHIYGHYFKTPEEGDRLANIFAQQMLSEKQKFYGESTVPYMSPGYTFNLTAHFNDTYNQEYLITEINHKGSQAGCLNPSVIGGLDKDAFDIDDQVAYQNTFTAIPAITQFRPEKLTERPRISGTLHAKIDAEGEGEYAEMDEHGRYKVRMPFDVNDGNLSGRASAFLRMMQPYAGENKGMQFPLTKGTEVMLTFTDGHPDRPLIAGAVNNFETPGPVNADNQTESVIQTGGGNRIRLEDKKGSERVIMESPKSDSWIRIGAHNDPVTLNGPATIYVQLDGTYHEHGASSLVEDGDPNTDTNSITSPTKIIKPDGSEIDSPSSASADNWIDTSVLGDWIFEYSHGVGNKKTRSVKVWETDSLADASPGDGIRIRTSSDIYLESNARTGDYTVLRNNDTVSLGLSNNSLYETDISNNYSGTGEEFRAFNGNLMDKFTEGSYAPTNNFSHKTAKEVTSTFGHASGSFRALLEHANVEISSVDTVTTQEGNIYDFGGYWNYNLGNSFAEEHINQCANLNGINVYEWPNTQSNGADWSGGYEVAAATGAGVGGAAAIGGVALVAFT